MRKHLLTYLLMAAHLSYLSFSLMAQESVETEPKESQPSTQNKTVNEVQLPPEVKQAIDSGELAAWMIETVHVAENYVKLLDQGRYDDSWTQSAALFRKTVSQKEWAIALELARKRLGSVKSRTVKDQRPAWNPKGLPKGAYMVVEYNTSFERAPNSGELLTLMRESNGEWKVLTYHVN